MIDTLIENFKINELVSDLREPEAEQCVLGALLSSQAGYKVYAKNNFLRPEHFSIQLHCDAYQAFIDLDLEINAVDGRKSITPLTIANRLNLGADDRKYLAKLTGLASSIIGYRQYANIIVEAHKKTSSLASMAEVMENLKDSNSEEISSSLKIILDDMEKTSVTSKTSHSSSVGRDILDELGSTREIYQTGLSQLDNATGGGFVAGKMYGFCARKKTGKTVLSGTLAYNLAKQGVDTFFIACEMSKKEIHQRVIARDIGRNCNIFLHKQVDKFRDEIQKSVDSDNGKLVYHDGQCMTFSQLKIEMNRAYNTLGTKVFILDYIQLIGGAKNRQSEASFMDEVSQWLAEFFLVTNTVGIVIAQMNQTGNVRGGEGIRLACSQCYELKRSETHLGYGQENNFGYYLEMMDTRYTAWMDIGSEEQPILEMSNVGPHFKEF